MSNISITHTQSGLLHASVVRTERISPNFVRVTVGGPGLERFEPQGFDQWFRLVIPVHDDDRLDLMPDRFGMAGYLRYLALPKGVRPAVRNYTVLQWRPSPAEIDIDFVVHGTHGVAAPWAVSAEPRREVAMIDQGCGWNPASADRLASPWVLLAADESALPAVAGILRDLPSHTQGHAFIELFDEADRQYLEAPDGVTIHWLCRNRTEGPGTVLLPAIRELQFPVGSVTAFAAGESALATGVRRHLVGERGVPKSQVTFCGYWKLGRAVHA